MAGLPLAQNWGRQMLAQLPAKQHHLKRQVVNWEGCPSGQQRLRALFRNGLIEGSGDCVA